MAKADREVHIYPTRREIDLERLAQALLSLVDQLSPKDKAYFLAEGDRVLQDLNEGYPKAKGSAA
jgi:hypothetical protein